MDLIGSTVGETYKVIELLTVGLESYVYKAQDIKTKKTVQFRFFSGSFASRRVEDIIRFKRDIEDLKKINNPLFLPIIESGDINGVPYVITDHIEGYSISGLISEQGAFSFPRILHITSLLLEGLNHLHQNGLLHRELKSPNVQLVHTGGEFPNIVFTEVGIHNIRDYKNDTNSSFLTSYNYMAPEQFGIIKRPIDERSDIYSLGVILFEMLTGRLPHKGRNINELIHKQLSTPPAIIISPEGQYPKVFEQMILKMLAIEPENRYQSIEGIIHDFESLEKGWFDFTPGMQDRRFRLDTTIELLGRDVELNRMIELQKHVLEDSGHCLFLSGEAGRGKTRLIEEYRSQTFSETGLYLESKGFPGRNKVPYGFFKDIIAAYIRHFNELSLSEQQLIRQSIAREMEGLEALVLKLNPELAVLIRLPEKIQSYEQEIENQRFIGASVKLLILFCSLAGNMTLVLDDIHWADDASIDVLEELINSLNGNPLYIIASYRDDEIRESLRKRITYLQQQLHSVSALKLNILELSSIQNLVAGLLHTKRENISEIAALIYKRSRGNPFFAIELVKDLFYENTIQLVNGKWVLHHANLKNHSASSSVVEILLKRINDMQDVDKSILAWAAVIGKQFNIHMLYTLMEHSFEIIVQVIDNAVEMQLLEEIHGDRGVYRFCHDRIRDAFYSLPGDSEREQMHNTIAENFESMLKMQGHEGQRFIFDLAHHYIEANNKEKILEYAYIAGCEAVDRYANSDAISYLNLVLGIRNERDEIGQAAWIDVKEKLAQINLWSGNVEYAITHYNALIAYSEDLYNTARLYKQIAQAYLNKWEWKKCSEYAEKALEALSFPLRKRSFRLPVIKKRKISKQELEKHKLIAWLYYQICTSYTMIGHSRVNSAIVQMIEHSERYLSMEKELALSYQLYAVYLAEQPAFKKSLVYHQKSLAIRKLINDEWGIATSYLNLGFYYKCSGNLKDSIECFRWNIDYLHKVGSLNGLGPGLSGLAGAYVFAADYPQAIAVTKEYAHLAEKVNSNFGRIISLVYETQIYTESGEFSRAYDSGLKAYHIARSNRDNYSLCIACCFFGQYFLRIGDDKEALRYLREAADLYDENFLQEYTSPLFPFLAEAYIRDFESRRGIMDSHEQKTALRKIKSACQEAVRRTEKWISFHPASLRVMGYYLGLVGKKMHGRYLYKKALEISIRLGRRFEEGRSLYEWGRFEENSGRTIQAINLFKQAFSLFELIGANEEQKRASRKLGIQDSRGTGQEQMINRLQYFQRIKTLFEMGRNISSILNTTALLSLAAEKAVEICRGRRCVLYLFNEDKIQLEEAHRYLYEKQAVSDPGVAKEVVDEVYKTGMAVLSNDLSSDDCFKHITHREKLKSVICVPLEYQDRIIGVCYIDNIISASVFSEEDKEILELLMSQLAISLENARLYRLAVTDGLTGLYNHRQFEILLDKECARSERYNHIFSVLMIDIDHFKQFNDTYGHLIGDKVLQYVSRIIMRECRATDIVSRFGGEEFVVILPETKKNDAYVVAEKIRKAIELDPMFESEIGYLQVQASIGIAAYKTDASETNTLLKRADDALYHAKKSGRNKSVLYSLSE